MPLGSCGTQSKICQLCRHSGSVVLLVCKSRMIVPCHRIVAKVTERTQVNCLVFLVHTGHSVHFRCYEFLCSLRRCSDEHKEKRTHLEGRLGFYKASMEGFMAKCLPIATPSLGLWLTWPTFIGSLINSRNWPKHFMRGI